MKISKKALRQRLIDLAVGAGLGPYVQGHLANTGDLAAVSRFYVALQETFDLYDYVFDPYQMPAELDKDFDEFVQFIWEAIREEQGE